MKSRNLATWWVSTALVVVAASPVWAQRGVGRQEGVARQAERPEVIELEGVLERVETGPCEATTGRAPSGAHLFLRAEDASAEQAPWNVHLGPDEAEVVRVLLERLQDEPADARLRIRAFRTPAMEAAHYVARTVEFVDGDESAVFTLRDQNLRPLWAGPGVGQGPVRARDFAPGQGRGVGQGRGARGTGAAGRGRGGGAGFGGGRGTTSP